MNRPVDIDEVASRANDQKTREQRRRGNAGGRVTDGKSDDVAQGGKRRGPGRWTDPESAGN